MKSPGNETIAAIATGSGCGIGIVRISGPEALAVANRIFEGRGGRSLDRTPPLTLLLGAVVEPASGEAIDEAFAVHMRAGRSYTGEPSVEIQCHGGRAVLDAVLRAALHAGARLARPGEFTKRAFLGGRLDLSQAEAVAELIAARTDGARRSALVRLEGSLGRRVRAMRTALLDQVALAEAMLDHGDEQVFAHSPDQTVIAALAQEARELIAAGDAREARDAGQRVVIAGKTNAGKSSLFNMLCNFERSIVSPVPGTTRDYVEACSTIGGSSVTLVDTAGLRDAPDEIESEGVRRSQSQMQQADLLIMTFEISLACGDDDLRLIEEFRDRSPFVVLTKSDLRAEVDALRLAEAFPELKIFSVSTRDGRGCPELLVAIADRCTDLEENRGAISPNQRQRESLRGVAMALDEAGALLNQNAIAFDLAAAELRRALSALGEITGETTSEEIADRIFSRFCVGK